MKNEDYELVPIPVNEKARKQYCEDFEITQEQELENISKKEEK